MKLQSAITSVVKTLDSPILLDLFPDPAFTMDKGLAHFAQNLGLPDLAEEYSCDTNIFTIVGGVWS